MEFSLKLFFTVISFIKVGIRENLPTRKASDAAIQKEVVIHLRGAPDRDGGKAQRTATAALKKAQKKKKIKETYSKTQGSTTKSNNISSLGKSSSDDNDEDA